MICTVSGGGPETITFGLLSRCRAKLVPYCFRMNLSDAKRAQIPPLGASGVWSILFRGAGGLGDVEYSIVAGSKKGERRGGAKPGHIRKTPKRHAGPGRPKGSKPKPKLGRSTDPAVVNILARHIPVAQKERELEMYFMVTGKRTRLPKEVLLDAMRYCEEMAVEGLEVYRLNSQRALEAQDPTARRVYYDAAAAAETNAREYLLAAVDVAYKAAPFVHPRLAAMLQNPGDGDQNNTIARLLEEIDRGGQACAIYRP